MPSKGKDKGMASSSSTGPLLPLRESEMTLEWLEEKLVEACLRTPEAKKVRKAEVADANACLERLHDFSYGVTYRQYMGLEVGATYKRLRFSEVLAAAGQRVERAKQLQHHYNDEGAGTGSAT